MAGPYVVAFMLQWVVLAILGVLLAGVLRYLTSIEERIDLAAPYISGLELGDRIPPSVLPDLAGRPIDVRSVIGVYPTLLLSVSPGCPACDTLTLEVAELSERLGGMDSLGWQIVLLGNGPVDRVSGMVHQVGGLASSWVTVLVDADGSVTRALAIRSSPVGIALDLSGRVVDQSLNPHLNWIYKATGAEMPPKPVIANPHGIDTVILPTDLRRR